MWFGVVEKDQVGKQNFIDCVKWKLGMGDKIRFWKDEWTGRGKFEDQFSRIFAIATLENMKVVHACNEGNESRG